MFPDEILAWAVALDPRHNLVAVKDGWGRDLKFVRRPPGQKNTTGYPQLTEVVLASAEGKPLSTGASGFL